MSVYDYDIGVIGGGAAGLTVASGSAQLGAKTVLVEMEDMLGGDCLHFGCVPSKTLIKSASVYHQLGRLTEFGLPAVEQPPVDFRHVRKRIEQTIGTIQHHDSVERFTGLGVDVCFGEAQFVDEHTIDAGNRRVSARKWVICTGSSPSLPPVPGLEDVYPLTNRTIFSLESLPESLIVIGGGPIGIEMAQAFSRLGSRVTLLQRSDQILSREDADLADELKQMLEREGLTIKCGCEFLGASRDGSEVSVIIKGEDGREVKISGSHLLVGAGRSVNVKGLKLENGGVDYTKRGIEVDRRMRTSQKHIYAAGDVVGGYQFTHAAGYEGGIVVSNAVMGLPRKTNYRWMPHCTYSDPELAGVGMSEKEAGSQGIECDVIEEPFSGNDRANAESETGGKIKLILDRKGNVLGVRILGIHAGELLSEWVATLNGGVKLSTIASAVHPYPTLGEINKRVVGSIFSKKIFSDRVRGILRTIHRYRG